MIKPLIFIFFIVMHNKVQRVGVKQERKRSIVNGRKVVKPHQVISLAHPVTLVGGKSECMYLLILTFHEIEEDEKT